MKPLTIDVISDLVCPWCFLGGEYLFGALALAPEVAVEVRWRPFQLAPDIPAEGMPFADYIQARFGDDMERFSETRRQLTERGAEVGLKFDFNALKKMPNTLNAHRLILWSAQGGPVGQARMVRALFAAHFEQGADIGDLDTLARIAVMLGVDKDVVTAFLQSGAGAENVRAEIDAAHRLGVSGVPFFIINTEYAVSGAQPSEALARALRQVASESQDQGNPIN